MMDLKKQTIRKPITDMIRCGRASWTMKPVSNGTIGRNYGVIAKLFE
jgi:hypothetical protein